MFASQLDLLDGDCLNIASNNFEKKKRNKRRKKVKDIFAELGLDDNSDTEEKKQSFLKQPTLPENFKSVKFSEEVTVNELPRYAIEESHSEVSPSGKDLDSSTESQSLGVVTCKQETTDNSAQQCTNLCGKPQETTASREKSPEYLESIYSSENQKQLKEDVLKDSSCGFVSEEDEVTVNAQRDKQTYTGGTDKNFCGSVIAEQDLIHKSEKVIQKGDRLDDEATAESDSFITLQKPESPSTAVGNYEKSIYSERKDSKPPKLATTSKDPLKRPIISKKHGPRADSGPSSVSNSNSPGLVLRERPSSCQIPGWNRFSRHCEVSGDEVVDASTLRRMAYEMWCERNGAAGRKGSRPATSQGKDHEKESEEKSKMNEKAFLAWRDQKRGFLIELQRKRKEEEELNKKKSEETALKKQSSEKAFNIWKEKKEAELKRQIQMKLDQQRLLKDAEKKKHQEKKASSDIAYSAWRDKKEAELREHARQQRKQQEEAERQREQENRLRFERAAEAYYQWEARKLANLGALLPSHQLYQTQSTESLPQSARRKRSPERAPWRPPSSRPSAPRGMV